MKLSIIIPCYNEGMNIPLLIKSLLDSINQRKDVEVILVNNGSTDDSESILNKEVNRNNNLFKIVNIKKNIGYGFGILTGLKNATGDVLSWTHADLGDLVEGHEGTQRHWVEWVCELSNSADLLSNGLGHDDDGQDPVGSNDRIR